MAATMRRIPFTIPDLDSLGLPDVVKGLTKLEKGFVLVTGPTGHGKSTTLAAMIDKINQERDVHTVTVEDPNIILVGELRDLETIAAVLTAAETGHLVFRTLHTNSAPQSIDRIIDVFPSGQQGQIRIQLANVLSAIVT
jgi:twitching motility protein PilT